MHDAKVLSASMASRAAFEKVATHVDVDEFSPLAAHWWPLVAEWYEADPDASSVDPEILRERGKRRTDEKHWDTMRAYFDGLPTDVSANNVVNELIEVKTLARGNELAAAIAANRRNDIPRLLHEYEGLLNAAKLDASVEVYAKSLDELDEELSDAKKYTLTPKVLNDRTDGGLLPGDFMILFARPEMGKTMFSVAQTAHWLREGHRVLYIGNEDPIDRIKGRVRMNLANMTKAEVEQWTDEANKRARERGIEDRLVMVHLHPGSAAEIDALIRKHEPDILVVDQLRNLAGRGENMTNRLNQVAIDIRQLLAKHHIAGLAIAQANAGEHGKTKIWLDMDDVDGSRTGIPAQADLLIGMSADNEMLVHNTRALALAKNKLSGNHDGLTINVDKARNKLL